MKRKLEAGEYPKGELKRIQQELDQIRVPRGVIGHNPNLPDGACVADRVTWLIRKVKALQQSNRDLRKNIQMLVDGILEKAEDARGDNFDRDLRD